MVDCLPNAVGKHTLDISWKKMNVKLMMMMMRPGAAYDDAV